MTELKTLMVSKRTAEIKRNLSEVAKSLHKHVVSLGGDPPSGRYGTGYHGDSGNDLDQIEQLCERVTTLCTFLESVTSSQSDSDQEVKGMWKWIQWLERSITPRLEKEIPPDPEDIGPPSETTPKVQETCRIVKSIWTHNQRVFNERQELLHINNECSREIADLEMVIKSDPKKDFARTKLKSLRKRCHKLQNTLTEETEKLTTSLAKVTDEKDYWISRMSNMAGKKLRDNNPDVLDLSDPDGPLKMADKFSELYDNQWTNASEHLHNSCQMSDEMTISLLSSLIKECYNSCYEKARRQMQYLEKIVLTGTWEEEVESCDSKPDSDKAPPVPQRISPDTEMMTLKETRKEFAHKAKERVIKDLLPVLLKSSGPGHESTAMTDYLTECISLCWGMVVQDPPIVLYWPLNKHGSDIDRDMFAQYTKTGRKLNYEVWPALLLHTNGPLLRKGVVQPL